MQRTIIAIKEINGRLVERKFNQFSWDLAGEDKNGWKEKTATKVISDIPKPPKGETQPKVEVPVSVKPTVKLPEVAQEIKNEFMTIASKIGKGMIKDYFDKQEPPIAYSNSANIIEIRTLLASHLNYDIKKLNEAFR